MRYSLDIFAEFEERGRSLQKVTSAHKASYEREPWDGELPGRAAELLERLPKLRARLDGDDRGLMDASDSGIDMSIATLLAQHGLKGWEIEGALRYWREGRGAREKHEGDYVETVGKALASAEENGRAELRDDSPS